MLRKQTATKTLCRTQHLVPSHNWASCLPDRKDDEVWPWQPTESKKFELPGVATVTGFKRFNNVPFAFNKTKNRLNVFFQRKYWTALKFTQLGEARCHEYYTHGTKSKAISTDKYCKNQFCNINIPNEISADFHNKKNSDYLMYSQSRANVNEAPHLDSELLHRSRRHSLWPRCRVCWSEYISSFRCTVCGWEDIWRQLDVYLQKKKKKVLYMLILRISKFIQCNFQVSSGIEQDLQWQMEVQRSNIVDRHFHHLQFSRLNSCIGCCCHSETSSVGGGRIFT